jgi:propionyl-CoA carboxylase alpha chain
MPGSVLRVGATVGDTVTAGQPLIWLEAMKMEHTVTAPADGVVTELTAKAGQQVKMDETLAVIGPLPAAPEDSGSLGGPWCSQRSTISPQEGVERR